MHKYIKIFKLGYFMGIKDAINSNYKIRKFKRIDDKDIIYKLYDIGYIKGYKKMTLKKNKSIV